MQNSEECKCNALFYVGYVFVIITGVSVIIMGPECRCQVVFGVCVGVSHPGRSQVGCTSPSIVKSAVSHLGMNELRG